MLEIPETTTLGQQIRETLSGKTIQEVLQPSSPHKFTWYNGDPEGYNALLTGRTVTGGRGHGAFVTLDFDEDIHLTVGDGAHPRYGLPGEERPKKHQLMLVFDDGSFLAFTVSMYGAIYAFRGDFDNPYYRGSLEKSSPLSERFDRACFDAILTGTTKDLSAKALLATEQRIPGLGNGVLQDILFNARIHPKRKQSTLTELEKADLFHALKTTLQQMTDGGGRDTEKDLFGRKGGYRSLLSKKTCREPCPHCGGTIGKEAYLGGAVYYCPQCQPLK